MQQWHKLAEALKMITNEEKRKNFKYTHILKLRTDYHHIDPKNILNELVATDGIICASDKVFGGSRDHMMLFKGFYEAINGFFKDKENIYWPINIDPILESDDSSKWYGMLFPKRITGNANSVEELRSIISKNRVKIKNELKVWKDPNHFNQSDYIQIFRGHNRFASEICFAKFLNINAIKTKNCSGLSGFLRSDRLER